MLGFLRLDRKAPKEKQRCLKGPWIGKHQAFFS